MNATDFLEDYSIRDFDVFSSQDEHFKLPDLLEQYAKHVQQSYLQNKNVEDKISLLKKHMVPVLAKHRQCDLKKAEDGFNKDCEEPDGKEMLEAFLLAMEEYAQQSKSNPSKLVEALEKIEDVLVEVSANLVNKSKEQDLVHKAFLISKKAVSEHVSNNNSMLEELEIWVKDAYVEKVGGERVFNETLLLSKIQSLKSPQK